MVRSLVPINSTSTPGTCAMASAAAIAWGVSSMTEIKVPALSAVVASPVGTDL